MLLNVIINWYGKCSAVVRWENSYSRYFPVTCGVRQGGVLSPFLFAIYVDDVIINLHNKRLGCTVGGSYIGCLMYADDLVLLSASLTVLQQMVDVCEREMTYLDMKFNTSKSMVIRIGKARKKVCDNIRLCGVDLQFVSTVKYLGVYVISANTFKLSFLESQSKFFRSVNGIFYKCKGNMCETVMMHLFSSYCKPILLYAVESVHLTNSNLNSLTHSWHAIFWKLFGTNDAGCINDIHRFMGYLPLVTEIDARRVGFLHRIKSCNNTVMSLLYEVFGKHELQALLSKYDITGTCSPYRFRFIVHN